MSDNNILRANVSLNLVATDFARPYDAASDMSLEDMNVGVRRFIEAKLLEYFGAFDSSPTDVNIEISVNHELVAPEAVAA